LPETLTSGTKPLEILWDISEEANLASDPLELLRYRSNLLGADLRITNFGGGNTSSKFVLPDPITGEPVRVMAVKGSGGDLRSMGREGFAILSMQKLEALIGRYRGEAFEDEIVGFYPLCAFSENRVAASIDTALHALLPFDHVDHLHPDWAIAVAASANGAQKLEEFNEQYSRNVAWVPWQRPGFELALMLRQAVQDRPGCDGIILGGHGLFTWGESQHACYSNSINTIQQLGEFIAEHARRQARPPFGGNTVRANVDRESTAAEILPYLRGVVSSNRRTIAHWEQSDEALSFASSAWAQQLCSLGTSCPDHFLRTRISPMFVPWDPSKEDVAALRQRIGERATHYRQDYADYYRSFATTDSPKLRDSNPSVVVIPGLGIFGFAKDKGDARITTEFFVNAIHVMQGANALEDVDGPPAETLPQARRAEQARQFSTFHNYVALPRSEAFRIEYWALEEAKLQRMPPEREFSRKVAFIVGGGSGIGREVALGLAERGAHVVVADQNADNARAAWTDAKSRTSSDAGMAVELDLVSRGSVSASLRAAVLQYGGVDIVINTAAIYPASAPSESTWSKALEINVTGNHLVVQEAARIFEAQGMPAAIVLTSSANAVVPKSGSEPYDVSKAAINHLIRELAVGLGPLVRVNGIAPATVVAGSSMFPRDRVIGSLQKYKIAFDESETTEALRDKLADFYAQRTITRQPILPADCAKAILWLAGDQSAKTTGHIIPVDGGLPEAFLR
jgi:rhamnose utilization protein RhaD (predicted bifunctional aldolase and dehydrogenase)/NAD(P)-dependent dehydrogenase (short-subunit alcohol dehydrogenase family)